MTITLLGMNLPQLIRRPEIGSLDYSNYTSAEKQKFYVFLNYYRFPISRLPML